MVNKELDEQGYKIVVEDSDMEVRIDPREPQGYILCVKEDKNKFIIFPRGTLEDLAKSDRDAGKAIIDNLVEYSYFIGEGKLNYDSINAIATKAYLKEKEDYEIYRFKQELDSE